MMYAMKLSNRFFMGALTALAILTVTVDTAEAGVKGGAFSGILLLDGSFAGTTSISFANNDTFSYTEVFTGEGSETYGGEYTEFFNLGFFSYFQVEGLDGSQNGIFNGTGYSLFNTLALINYSNPDYTVDWTGVYIRTGVAPANAPATSGGSAGK